MLLIIDENEQTNNPEIVLFIKRSFSNVIVTSLPHREHGGIKVTAGDINIPLDDGSILAIERKTPEDFLSSIASRHIFHQVEVMANNAKFSAIIVTGAFTYGKRDDMCYIRFSDTDEGRTETNWSGVSVRAAIASIQYSGCPVIFCPPSRYCQTISELYTLVNKPSEHQSIKKNRIITFPPVDERVEYLAQFPGIGLKHADSLLKFAGMMDSNADEDGYGTISSALHWMTILSHMDKDVRPAGWGPLKILNTRKFLGLASNQYIKVEEEK